MAEPISQADRWLTLDTALGTDMMLATEAVGTEAISELFDFRVSALSPKTTIAPEDILGKPATLSMARPKDTPRIVNGIVTSISAGSVTRGDHRLYTLVISPMLWTLGLKSDYRVFQGKSVPTILEEILDKIKYKNTLVKDKYEKRDYCTQFGETDLAFFQRLAAEQGIFYYFTHAKSEHTLVLCDTASAYADASQDAVEYRHDAEAVANTVAAFDMASHLTESSWTLSDYDYEVSTNPSSVTKKTTLKPASVKQWERFRFGAGPKAQRVNLLATAAIDATDAGFEITHGRSGAASFTPGHRFTIVKHPVNDVVNKKFVLTRVAHESRDPTYFTVHPGAEAKPYYRNTFSCIPADRIARQPLPPQKPVVRGPMTAVVVGKKGSVSTDDMGRIKIAFNWDRKGEENGKESCLVRVAQPLAGSGWGGVFIPRGGMEVVVHFLDGDPDRPLVTGAVYNVDNKAPWITKESATKSGFLTVNVGEGAIGTAHELSFDDKAGQEKITIHAQKDFLREVENDDTLDVGNDQKRTIKNNRTTTISNGNDELKIVSGNQTVKADAGQVTIEAVQGIKLKCANNVIEVTQQGIKINGIVITVTGTAKAETSAPVVQISADGMATLKGGIVNIN
jgi:type VI secretion system secreted protein VgrG